MISFTLSRLDSARATLGQGVREWRRAERAVDRGDPLGMMVFRNTVLGLAASHGAADVERLYDQRGAAVDGEIEQVTAGVDVQDDRLVHVVLGFTAGNREVAVLDFGSTLGDPRDAEPWAALASALGQPFGGLPVSVVSVDAGFLTSDVRRNCSRRRWWIPTVGRAGDGKQQRHLRSITADSAGNRSRAAPTTDGTGHCSPSTAGTSGRSRGGPDRSGW